MFTLKSIEVRFALLLAIIAFTVSPLIGVVAGVPLGTVILRTVLLSLFFGGVGFGMLNTLKRFVPEIYSVVSKAVLPQTDDAESVGDSLEENSVSSDGGEGVGIVNDKEDLDTATSNGENTFDPGVSPSTAESMGIGDSKVGHHLLEEKGMKYEPELMAEAIRTMMSKDDE